MLIYFVFRSFCTIFATDMTEQLIIGYDAKRIVRNATGLGSYSRTLVNDLASLGTFSLRLYAPDAGRDDLRCQITPQPHVKFCYPKDVSLPFDKAIWRTRGIAKDLRRDGVRLFHGLSGELPHGLRRRGIRSVVTIHDLIFLRHPEYYNWIDRQVYTWKFHHAVKAADHIIAISECTRRDIIEFGNVDEQKISVIYQSCAPRFSPESDFQKCEQIRLLYGLPKRFILQVGTIEARKNAMLSVRALHHLPKDLALVLVGRHTEYTNKIMAYASEQGLSHRLFLFHDVPDDHLPCFYAEAEAFVYPSRYEGFGIPIIEAIRCGLPVVACTGSCLEEAGGPDCLYVSPDDAEALADAVVHTLHGAEGREQRIMNSQQYIRRFEGADVASQVFSLYQSLL